MPDQFFTGSGLLNTSSYSSESCGVVDSSIAAADQEQCLSQLLQISTALYETPIGR